MIQVELPGTLPALAGCLTAFAIGSAFIVSRVAKWHLKLLAFGGFGLGGSSGGWLGQQLELGVYSAVSKVDKWLTTAFGGTVVLGIIAVVVVYLKVKLSGSGSSGLGGRSRLGAKDGGGLGVATKKKGRLKTLFTLSWHMALFLFCGAIIGMIEFKAPGVGLVHPYGLISDVTKWALELIVTFLGQVFVTIKSFF